MADIGHMPTSKRNLAVVLKVLGKDGEAAAMLNVSTERLGKSQLEMLGWQVERWYQLGAFMSLDLWVGLLSIWTVELG